MHCVNALKKLTPWQLYSELVFKVCAKSRQRKDSSVSGVRGSLVLPRNSEYTPRVCYPYYSTAPRPGLSHKLIGKKLDSFHLRCQWRILHINWYDFMFNNEVLRLSGLFDISYIVCKQRLGLFGHVARLRSDALANQILRICTKTRDGDRPSQDWRCTSGWPPPTGSSRSAVTWVLQWWRLGS